MYKVLNAPSFIRLKRNRYHFVNNNLIRFDVVRNGEFITSFVPSYFHSKTMEISFRTTVNTTRLNPGLNHQTPVMMVGSCFSDNIGNELKRLKIPVLLNPFGVLYNPMSIAKALKIIINNQEMNQDELILHDHLWHSFLFHGSFSGTSSHEVLQQIQNAIETAHHFLKKTEFLFITFGTAWVFKHKKTEQLVANCHKIPAIEFDRYRLNISEINHEWEMLIYLLMQFNPKLKIIFTVSPVRHLKDGAHGNQLSKSTLLLSIDQLISTGSYANQLSYFPSYEIVNDELRDYRFYADDMVHPSNKAVQFIFEKFSDTYFNETTKQLNKEINAVVEASEHRILTSNSIEIEKFKTSMLKKIHLLENKNPFLDFYKEKNHFKNL